MGGGGGGEDWSFPSVIFLVRRRWKVWCTIKGTERDFAKISDVLNVQKLALLVKMPPWSMKYGSLERFDTYNSFGSFSKNHSSFLIADNLTSGENYTTRMDTLDVHMWRITHSYSLFKVNHIMEYAEYATSKLSIKFWFCSSRGGGVISPSTLWITYNCWSYQWSFVVAVVTIYYMQQPP